MMRQLVCTQVTCHRVKEGADSFPVVSMWEHCCGPCEAKLNVHTALTDRLLEKVLSQPPPQSYP